MRRSVPLLLGSESHGYEDPPHVTMREDEPSVMGHLQGVVCLLLCQAIMMRRKASSLDRKEVKNSRLPPRHRISMELGKPQCRRLRTLVTSCNQRDTVILHASCSNEAHAMPLSHIGHVLHSVDYGAVACILLKAGTCACKAKALDTAVRMSTSCSWLAPVRHKNYCQQETSAGQYCVSSSYIPTLQASIE